MSWQSGPRSFHPKDIDAWTEQVVEAMIQVGRQAEDADAAWHAVFMHRFPTCWLVYLAPMAVLAGALVLAWLGGEFIGIGMGFTRNRDWGIILFAAVLLLVVLLVVLLTLAGFAVGFWRMNWIAKCVSIWYAYSVASFMLRNFYNFPFTVWLGGLAVSMCTEAIAQEWKRRHSPTD